MYDDCVRAIHIWFLGSIYVDVPAGMRLDADMLGRSWELE